MTMLPKPLIWIPCPECHQRSGISLPMMAALDMDYFECAECGHVRNRFSNGTLPNEKHQ
jgi:Zn ribbon nucleic-acid-binding protein